MNSPWLLRSFLLPVQKRMTCLTTTSFRHIHATRKVPSAAVLSPVMIHQEHLTHNGHGNLLKIPRISERLCIVVKRDLKIASKSSEDQPLLKTDPWTKSVTLFRQLQKIQYSPVPALVLGFSGLVPFILSPTYMMTSQLFMPTVASAQAIYGATILSFLGGVRWGFALHDDGPIGPDWTNLGYSVLPCLLAWASLLLPEPLCTVGIIGGLGGAAYFDTMSHGYPDWFKALRFILSFVAVLSLWTTLMCRYTLDDEISRLEKTEKALSK